MNDVMYWASGLGGLFAISVHDVVVSCLDIWQDCLFISRPVCHHHDHIVFDMNILFLIYREVYVRV